MVEDPKPPPNRSGLVAKRPIDSLGKWAGCIAETDEGWPGPFTHHKPGAGAGGADTKDQLRVEGFALSDEPVKGRLRATDLQPRLLDQPCLRMVGALADCFGVAPNMHPDLHCGGPGS